METHHRQGGSELLKSIFGTIAGGLSLFPYNPFRRKKAEDDLLNDAAHASMDCQSGEIENSHRKVTLKDPISDIVLMQGTSDANGVLNMSQDSENLGFAGAVQTSSDLIKLYPDMELAETRKRVVQGTHQDQGEWSKKKKKKAAEKVDAEASEKTLNASDENLSGSGETLDGSDVTLNGSDEALDGSDEALDCSDETLHGSDVGAINDHDETRDGSGEASDETLDGSKETVSAEKAKQGKRGQDLSEQALPRKRLKVGKSETPTLGFFYETLSSQSAHGKQVDGDIITKKRLSGMKRKKEDSIEARYEKKLRALTISEEPAHNKEKKSMAGMAGIRSRKRERIGDDDDDATIMRTFDDEKKLKRTIFVGNLPSNAKRKSISKELSQYGAVESIRLRSIPLLDTKIPMKGAIIKDEINETLNSQNSYIVYKDELSANAALAHNMKEFNGNHIRVHAAHAPAHAPHGALKERSSVFYDHARSIFVGNVPFDVKDEELYQIFGIGKSSEMDVEAVRVVRDPHTSLSEGIAFVLFKTEAGVSHILSSKRTLKLRDRVLQVSRVLVSAQTEQRPPPRLAKRLRDSEAEGSGSQKKRIKPSSPYEGTRATKGLEWQGKRTLRAVGRNNNNSKPTKESISMHPISSRIHAKRQVGVNKGLSKSPESLSGAKRKRVEKRQRGISRSKKIRRT